MLLLVVWIASIRFTICYFASTFSSSPTETQYWSYVRSGRVYFGENKSPGEGVNIKASIFNQLPSVGWSFSLLDTTAYRVILVPLWAPTLLAGLTAAWCWKRERHRRNLAKIGSCPACGYSREGLHANAPCPECGSDASSLASRPKA